jgi:hypothetical protein
MTYIYNSRPGVITLFEHTVSISKLFSHDAALLKHTHEPSDGGEAQSVLVTLDELNYYQIAGQFP